MQTKLTKFVTTYPMLWLSDETEELELSDEEEDDEDASIGDDALEELADDDEEDDDDGEGFGHLDEKEEAVTKTGLEDDEEEDDEDDLPLEEDAEDVDYDSFDDIDEF